MQELKKRAALTVPFDMEVWNPLGISGTANN
jgi:hypothetical protein